MRQFGLIGYPLWHSFSKKYFTEKFKKENIIDALFEAYPIESINELPSLLKANPALRGLSVTIPYKQAVLAYLDSKDAVLNKINACNCIKIVDGQLHGYNTDVIGFHHSLLQKLQPAHSKALVLGTGGASKAVTYVLKQLHIEYIYVSRTAKEGIDHSIKYEDLTDDIISSHLLIINTTPLGMFPNEDAAPRIKYDLLTPQHYLFDLVYNPSKTLFLQKGEKKGAIIQNGYDMLTTQAEASWKIWNA